MPTLSLVRLPGKQSVYARAEPRASAGVHSAMHVVEIFLPLKRSDGAPQPGRLFAGLRAELVERFGGLTAFTRSPAEGVWEDDHERVERDEIVIVEVITEALDRDYWAELRSRLERDFAQEEVLIRASPAERL